MKPTEKAKAYVKLKNDQCNGLLSNGEKLAIQFAYMAGFNEALSQMEPECDNRFNSLMESVNAIAEIYRVREKTSVEHDKYAEAIEYSAKVQALEEVMKEAGKISSMFTSQPPTKH